MSERDNNTFALPHIQIQELVTTVSNLSVAKAAEALPVRLIKNNFDILGIHLLHILNHTLGNGVYPVGLQVKKLIPIFKSGERSDRKVRADIAAKCNQYSFCKGTLKAYTEFLKLI